MVEGNNKIKYRIGLIMIILSYLFVAVDICLFQIISDKYIYIADVCLVIAILILLFGIYLTDFRTNENNTKLDNVLKSIAFIPVIVIIAIPFTIFFTIIYIFFGEKPFVLKTRPLRKAGYKMEIKKENKSMIYYFKYDKLILKFIPNEIYDVSFDCGNNYVPILETNIGTVEEIEHRKNIQHQYETVDYRDRDLYDPNAEYVKFVIRNLSPKNMTE